MYLGISDCFSTKGLLLIKNKTKQNIIPTNRDVPQIHEEKKNQPLLPLLCFQRLGSILFPFVWGDDGRFAFSLTLEALSQEKQTLLVPSVDAAL